jgi:hypothetical protein
MTLNYFKKTEILNKYLEILDYEKIKLVALGFQSKVFNPQFRAE